MGLAWSSPCGGLTVKLSGRAQASDWSRGRILSFRARGDTTELHGPLQRLLERTPDTAALHSAKSKDLCFIVAAEV